MSQLSNEGKKAIQDKISAIEQANSDLAKTISDAEQSLKTWTAAYKANQVKIDELKSDLNN